MAFITGASGGLGAGLAEEFLAAGWRVIAGFHSRAPSLSHPGLIPLPCNLLDPAQAKLAPARALEVWGRVDALINNAGITRDKLLAQTTLSDWDEMLRLNLRAPFVLAQGLVPAMAAQGGGQIVNIASLVGLRGAAGQAGYAAAKAGLLGLTQSLAQELGPQNIRVNAVLPGLLPTGMTSGLAGPEWRAAIARNVLGRTNSIEEVARFVCFLAGTRNISGQVFALDSRPPKLF